MRGEHWAEPVHRSRCWKNIILFAERQRRVQLVWRGGMRPAQHGGQWNTHTKPVYFLIIVEKNTELPPSVKHVDLTEKLQVRLATPFNHLWKCCVALVKAELLSNHNQERQLFHQDFNSEMLPIHLATQRILRPVFHNQSFWWWAVGAHSPWKTQKDRNTKSFSTAAIFFLLLGVSISWPTWCFHVKTLPKNGWWRCFPV